MPATRSATLVSPEDSLSVTGSARPFVSRGGEKLAGALNRLSITVAGRTWLDAGASTGTGPRVSGASTADCTGVGSA